MSFITLFNKTKLFIFRLQSELKVSKSIKLYRNHLGKQFNEPTQTNLKRQTIFSFGVASNLFLEAQIDH